MPFANLIWGAENPPSYWTYKTAYGRRRLWSVVLLLVFSFLPHFSSLTRLWHHIGGQLVSISFPLVAGWTVLQSHCLSLPLENFGTTLVGGWWVFHFHRLVAGWKEHQRIDVAPCRCNSTMNLSSPHHPCWQRNPGINTQQWLMRWQRWMFISNGNVPRECLIWRWWQLLQLSSASSLAPLTCYNEGKTILTTWARYANPTLWSGSKNHKIVRYLLR